MCMSSRRSCLSLGHVLPIALAICVGAVPTVLAAVTTLEDGMCIEPSIAGQVPGDDCCVPHPASGCGEAVCEACVCAATRYAARVGTRHAWPSRRRCIVAVRAREGDAANRGGLGEARGAAGLSVRARAA